MLHASPQILKDRNLALQNPKKLETALFYFYKVKRWFQFCQYVALTFLVRI